MMLILQLKHHDVICAPFKYTCKQPRNTILNNLVIDRQDGYQAIDPLDQHKKSEYTYQIISEIELTGRFVKPVGSDSYTLADEHTKKYSVIRRLRCNQRSKKKGEQAETATSSLKVANTVVDDGVATTVGNDEVANTVGDGVATTVGNDEVADTVGGNEGRNQNDDQHKKEASSTTVRVRVDKRVRSKSLLATYPPDDMSSPLAQMKKG